MLSCTLGGTSNIKKDITIFTINYLILPHDIWLLLLSIIYRMQNKGEKNTKRQPKEIDENERLLLSLKTNIKPGNRSLPPFSIIIIRNQSHRSKSSSPSDMPILSYPIIPT